MSLILQMKAVLTYSDEVSKANPAPQGLGKSLSSKPSFPFALDYALLEQRAGEENSSQEQAAEDFKEANGPPSQQAEGLGDGCIAFLRGDSQDQQGADAGGNTDCPNPGPDDGRRISTQCGRRPSR
jgi:hypothetical protein